MVGESINGAFARSLTSDLLSRAGELGVVLHGLVQDDLAREGSTRAVVRCGSQELVVTKFRDIDGYDVSISLGYMVGVRGAVGSLDDVVDVARALARKSLASQLVDEFSFLHASESSLAVESGNGIPYHWDRVLKESQEWSNALFRLLSAHPVFGKMLPTMSHGSARLIENGLTSDVPDRFRFLATIVQGSDGLYRGYVSHGESEVELRFSAPDAERTVHELEQRLTVP